MSNSWDAALTLTDSDASADWTTENVGADLAGVVYHCSFSGAGATLEHRPYNDGDSGHEQTISSPFVGLVFIRTAGNRYDYKLTAPGSASLTFRPAFEIVRLAEG
jgi:hypothetical protein